VAGPAEDADRTRYPAQTLMPLLLQHHYAGGAPLPSSTQVAGVPQPGKVTGLAPTTGAAATPTAVAAAVAAAAAAASASTWASSGGAVTAAASSSSSSSSSDSVKALDAGPSGVMAEAGAAVVALSAALPCGALDAGPSVFLGTPECESAEPPAAQAKLTSPLASSSDAKRAASPIHAANPADSRDFTPRSPASVSPPPYAFPNASTLPLRKGKWTAEEEAFTACIISQFSKGLLNLTCGTTLRSFLSEKLHCDPMRITKKFAGASCIGKQVFQPCARTPENVARVEQSQRKLLELEANFHKKIADQKAAKKTPSSVASNLGAKPCLTARVKPERGTLDEQHAADSYVTNDDEGRTYSQHHRFSLDSASLSRSISPFDENYTEADKQAGGLLLDFFATVRKNTSPVADIRTSDSVRRARSLSYDRQSTRPQSKRIKT